MNEPTAAGVLYHQCVDAIAPALAGFVNALNDEQSAQLNAMLGVAPQPERAAR